MKIDQQLRKASLHRKPIQLATNAFRLVNGLGDGMPGITIDCYNRHFLIQLYRNPPLFSPHEIAAYLLEHFDPDYLMLKDRTLPAAECQDTAQVLFARCGSDTQVTENNLFFQVDLDDALNPGLFLDMRANRRLLGKLSKGKQVFNGFAYTCAFGVYAASHGAKRVVNADISKKILDWGQQNYTLNSLPVQKEDFVAADVAAYLKGADKHDNHFDLIILDPPTFSRVQDKTFSVQKDFPSLIENAMRILNPRGLLFLSTNCSAISCADLKHWAVEGSRRQQRAISSCQFLGQDIDFPKNDSMKESHLAAILLTLP